MLPPFDEAGNLPPGIHEAIWDEIQNRFGGNEHRQRLLVGLRVALDALASAGCVTVYLDGSFVTDKAEPNDYDVCWEPGNDLDPDDLPVPLIDFRYKQAAQKKAYGGEFFLFDMVASFGPTGKPITFLDFFQSDGKRAKGIVRLVLPIVA